MRCSTHFLFYVTLLSQAVTRSSLEHHTLISFQLYFEIRITDHVKHDHVLMCVLDLICCIGCFYLRIQRRGASRWRGEDCADSPDKPAPPRPDTANRWPGFPDFPQPCCSLCDRPRPGSSYLCWSDGPVACLLLLHALASSSPAAVTLITHGFDVWKRQLLLLPKHPQH